MSTDDPGEFSSRQWPDWSFWRDRSGRSSHLTVVVFTGCGALFLIVRAALILHGGHGPTRTVAALGLLALYGVGCLFAPWYGPLAPRRQRVAIVAGMFAVGAGPALVLATPDYLTDLTYAVATGLMLLPLRWSVPLGFGTALAQIGWMWLAYGRVAWGEVATLVVVTAALGIVFALMFTIGQLRAAREQIRRLAVDQERQRVARDLHDVLGHSLTAMTVKLGVTRRMLESGTDTAPALAEVRELEGLSRRALSDVRATVSGYREVSLAAELAGARIALRAAGVRAELPAGTDDVRPELREVFGYVVREAVTNVLRHSDAERCRIELGADWVTVTDNGSGADGAAAGHGLRGLTERLTAVSGVLEHGRAPGGGFRVLARGPA